MRKLVTKEGKAGVSPPTVDAAVGFQKFSLCAKEEQPGKLSSQRRENEGTNSGIQECPLGHTRS